MFTYQYTQPNEYHFSLDSIYLARIVAEHFQSHIDLQSLRVLDLCAGCGVVGFELSWHIRALKQIDFVEVQDVYTHYFHENTAIVNRPELQFNWHLLNYDKLLEKQWEKKFDLIISNPPYFQLGQGMLSPSVFKNRCRFFLDSTFENFISSITNALAFGGKAYFLLRSSKQHGFDSFTHVQTLLQETTISAKKIAQIRGSDIVLLNKL